MAIDTQWLQVPGPQQKVEAAVRSADKDRVVREEKEVPIPPKPVIMHQDVSLASAPTGGQRRSNFPALALGCDTQLAPVLQPTTGRT